MRLILTLLTWFKNIPQQRIGQNSTISSKDSLVLDTEIQGLLKKRAICEVGRVQGKNISSHFAVTKFKRTADK